MRLSRAEVSRLKKLSQFESELRVEGYLRVAGVDEAGRGPLAGPVVAAACILPENFALEDVNDSKQLSPQNRDRLFASLSQNPQVLYGIGIVEAADIDRINILQATFLAMQKAIAALPEIPDYLLVDGDKLPRTKIPARAVVKGDSLSISIASASIFAKVTRDRIMDALDAQYPLYGFKNHKGYGTSEHLQAIDLYGPCPIHRKSFDPIKSQLELKLF
ncbi:MAG: ribonuclease HII [Verrucomicrobia bacterium]|nr:ribonuclease HII [Verrucomicrobiota bacterium]